VCIYIYINVLWKHFQVPNGVGVLLGSAQLILYAVYKNKSNIISTKSTEKMEEEGSAHLVKGIIQMQAFHEDDEEVLKNRSLNKGRSLPKPPVNRQYSFQRISKTFSLSPYEIHANYAHEDDVENGEKIHP
jgi:solute carrier family 50 protein (sugar transporter)